MPNTLCQKEFKLGVTASREPSCVFFVSPQKVGHLDYRSTRLDQRDIAISLFCASADHKQALMNNTCRSSHDIDISCITPTVRGAICDIPMCTAAAILRAD
jgi:hypothetical protein